MRNSLKKYLTGIWGIEIILIIILSVSLGFSYYQSLNNELIKLGAGPMDSLFDKEGYIKARIKYQSKSISETIYTYTNNLSDITNLKSDNEYYRNEPNYYSDIFYILINKDTLKFTTNDDLLYQFILDELTELPEIENFAYKYIEDKGFTYYKVDNVNTFNYYVESLKVDVDKSYMKNYIEIYYRSPSVDYYLLTTDNITAQVIIASIILLVFLSLKTIINLIFNRDNIHLEIKVFQNIFYVLKDGIKYKNTRNKIIIAFSGAILVLFIYLYLVAGIRNQNVLVTFLSSYPFKATLILVLVPLFCVIYSLKKSLDVSIINEGLKKINSGDLDYNIEDIGEREVKELVENINKVKNAYKVALDEKVRNEKLKTELISNVSHDLKTPLTSIINYVNILNNQNVTEEEKIKYLDILEKNSKRLKSLIEDLFEASKLNSGKMKIEKHNIDIISLIYQGLGEYSNLYEEKNIDFKLRSDKEEIFLNLDGKLISRVFENIIINSLKYSLENTRVYIDVEDKENSVRISFKNIANYEMDFNEKEMFERFARADKSRNSKVEGSGMGLAIAKSIIDLHNGSIDIEVEGDMFKIHIFLPKEVI